MATTTRLFLLASFVAFAAAGCDKAPGGTPAKAATQRVPADATPRTEASEQPTGKLAWLAGQWCGKDDTQLIEETWLAPVEGETVGLSRTVAGGRMISYEFMRIEEIEGKVILQAQPGGEPAADFARSDGGEDWIRFENKQHDYPQRIEYRRAGEGLHAEIGGPGEPGKESVISYDYKRCGT